MAIIKKRFMILREELFADGRGFCISSGPFFGTAQKSGWVERSKNEVCVFLCPPYWPTWSTNRATVAVANHVTYRLIRILAPRSGKEMAQNRSLCILTLCSADSGGVELVLIHSRGKNKKIPILKIKPQNPPETKPCHFSSYFLPKTSLTKHLLSPPS